MSEAPPLSYADAVAALTERGRFGISLGLARVERLMAEVGHPERGLRGALVGGTNGKGSVVAMVRAALGAAGYTVGTMPKPHLVSYRERIAIDGEPISPADFATAVTRVLPAIDRVAAEIGPPTEFEALTAAAILELARRRVDLAVVEVGMGGRLDATNVLDLGVAAITNVQLDHERYLGTTLRAIGAEKAPIIKRGNRAVTGARGRGLRPIVDRCAMLNVPLRRAGPSQPYAATLVDSGWDGLTVDLRSPSRTLDDVRVGLLGAHQSENAAVAMAVLDAIVERWDVAVTDDSIRAGLAAARWPGRLELLDGAHNPAGAAALARSLADLGLRGPRIVFGAMRGKKVREVLRALAPLDPQMVFTAVEDPGALPPHELAAVWRDLGGRAGIEPDPAAAVRGAQGDPVVVAGSLYLVGAVRGMITGTGEED